MSEWIFFSKQQPDNYVPVVVEFQHGETGRTFHALAYFWGATHYGCAIMSGLQWKIKPEGYEPVRWCELPKPQSDEPPASRSPLA